MMKANKKLAGPVKSALNRAVNHRTVPTRPVLGQTHVWPNIC
jgi:hypothetical protein